MTELLCMEGRDGMSRWHTSTTTHNKASAQVSCEQEVTHMEVGIVSGTDDVCEQQDKGWGTLRCKLAALVT